MKIELLQGIFPISETPGLDSTDPRVDEIATLAQSGEYAEAAALSEAIFAEGVYDVRLICFFLYGYWLEEGLASLADVVNCLNNVIVENCEAVGLFTKQGKNFEKSLDWLFRQILKKIQYEESKNSTLWQQWQADILTEEVNKILESGEVFRSSINHQLEDKALPIVNLWSKIEKWLRVFQQLECPPLEPVQAEPEESDDDISVVVNAVPTTAFKSSGLQMESSYHMDLLLKKLAAFERLVQEQKFPRAALVADDINQTLSMFDPMLYFPKMLGAFIRLQALNFDELSSYADHRESQQWQAMQDWLKIDVDSFINY
ncbi:MAG: hypothetical protein RLZZ419_413 [Pseudomonadota bacterium]|jgi:hypothetical protein